MGAKRKADRLSDLPVERLREMAAAGEQVREAYRVLKRAGHNVVGQVLAHQGQFVEWNHYPKGDVYDRESAGQYYYHAHRGPVPENGHFHVFLRSKGIPKTCKPAPYDGDGPRPLGDEAVAHLVAISMDRYGYPIAMFTTNRWVTGETFYAAAEVMAMLEHFEIDHTFPCLATNRWITAMLRLFRPQIETLVAERDACIAGHQRAHPDRDVYEDRDLEITSHARISVDDQVKAVARQLARAA